MEFPSATWRLVQTPPAHGAWNMAVDEAILEAVAAGESPATLRLYAWQPACLSLGYAQPFSDVDLPALTAYGWEWVRRPTGGRAILHTDELTYAVIGSQDDPRLAGSVLESYQHLAQALVLALHMLGLQPQSDADPKVAPGSDPKGAVCFDVPSPYEITVDQKKLVGSAQRRSQQGVLQHGTLPLTGDLRRITQGLCFPDSASRQQAAVRLLERATTVETVLGIAPSWDEAATAFADAFQQALNLRLSAQELSQSELRRAEQLVREKYTHPAWNKRV